MGNGPFAMPPGLYFYQSDIDAFLQTKAAANTMVEYMLDALGVPMDQVGSSSWPGPSAPTWTRSPP